MQQVCDVHDVLCRETQAYAACVHQALQQHELSACVTACNNGCSFFRIHQHAAMAGLTVSVHSSCSEALSGHFTRYGRCLLLSPLSRLLRCVGFHRVYLRQT